MTLSDKSYYGILCRNIPASRFDWEMRKLTINDMDWKEHMAGWDKSIQPQGA